MGQNYSRPPTGVEADAFWKAERERATAVAADQPETTAMLRRLWQALEIGRSTSAAPLSDDAPAAAFEAHSPLWKTVGFQNPNPLSDVRGGGALALSLLATWAEASAAAAAAVAAAAAPAAALCDDGAPLSAAAMARRQRCRANEGDIACRRYFPLCTAGVSITVLLLRLFKQGGLALGGGSSTGSTGSSGGSGGAQGIVLPAAGHWPFVRELPGLFGLVMGALEARFVTRSATYMEYPAVQEEVLGALVALMPEAAEAAARAVAAKEEEELGRWQRRQGRRGGVGGGGAARQRLLCVRELSRLARSRGLDYVPLVASYTHCDGAAAAAAAAAAVEPGPLQRLPRAPRNGTRAAAHTDNDNNENSENGGGGGSGGGGLAVRPPITVHAACRSAVRFAAAEAGDLTTVEAWLVPQGETNARRPAPCDCCSVDDRDHRARWTQLHFAARFGHARVAAALLRAGADADALCPSGMSALEWAVHYRGGGGGGGGHGHGLGHAHAARRAGGSPAAVAAPPGEEGEEGEESGRRGSDGGSRHTGVVAELLRWASSSAGRTLRHAENALLLAAAAGHADIVALLVALHTPRFGPVAMAAAAEAARARDRTTALAALRMGEKERSALRREFRWQRRRAVVLARGRAKREDAVAAPAAADGCCRDAHAVAAAAEKEKEVWAGARLPEYAFRAAVSFL